MPPKIPLLFTEEAALEGGLADFDADPFALSIWDDLFNAAWLGMSILRALFNALSPDCSELGKQRKATISIVPTLRYQRSSGLGSLSAAPRRCQNDLQ